MNTEYITPEAAEQLARKIEVLEDNIKKLREERETLRIFMNNVTGGVEICELNDNFSIIYVSDGFTRLTGYTLTDLQQLFNSSHATIMPPEDFLRVKDEMNTQLKRSGSFSVEYPIKRKDGEIVWILDEGCIVYIPGRHPVVQCTITDITRHKQIEESLQISEQQYKIAMNHSDVTMFDYDPVTKKMLFQQSAAIVDCLPEVTDTAVETLVNTQFVSPNSTDKYRQMCQKIDAGSPFEQAIIHVQDAAGAERVLELHLTNIFGLSGQPIRAVGVKKDMTQAMLLQREREYGSTLVSNRRMAYEANLTRNTVTWFDPDWAKELALTKIRDFSEMITAISTTVILPEHREAFLEKSSKDVLCSNFESGNRLLSFEYRKKVAEGEYEWFEKTINIIQDEITKDIHIRCYMVNVNQRKQKELQALAEQKHYEVMLSKSVIVYEVNITQNKFISGHECWKELFGVKPSDSYTKMIEEFVDKALHPDDRDAFCLKYSREQVMYSHHNGENKLICEYRRPDETDEFVWVRCAMNLFEDPQTNDLRGFCYVEKIHEQKKKELELIYKSQHDMLSGFYNKTTVEERINTFISTSEGRTGKHAFFIIDLDYFKAINDNFGHAFGDAVLSQVSSKINSLFRDDDILGRIGGDEFVILMKNIQNELIVNSKATEISKIILEAYTQKGVEYKISASIGLAFYPEHGKTYEKLYWHSDAALYYSKENGRNCFSVFRQGMRTGMTMVKEIEQTRLVEVKTFDEDITQYVFRILYESSDKEAAINAVLAMIGKHYNMNRAYVFEDSEDGQYTTNTFEWCNQDVESHIQNLKNISYSSLDNYQSNFNEEGIFYMADIDKVSLNVQKILEPQAVKSMLQFSILKNGKFVGFIGLDQCGFVRIPTAKELSDVKIAANILGVFITEMRALRASKMSTTIAMSIINGLDSYAYVCDPETFQILFINEKTLSLVPGAGVGDICYKTFWNSEKPCDSCPMQNLFRSARVRNSIDMYNFNLKIWVKATASWIDWLDGKPVCLVDSVDISQYKGE